MGQELACRLRLGRKTHEGKALLETDYLLFRGEERLKIVFKDLKRVTASADTLRLEYDGGAAELELGPAAAKWADKILNPPPRASKLGIKPGLNVRAIGKFPPNSLHSRPRRPAAEADLIFFAAPKAASLIQVAKLAASLGTGGALWVIYPKGVKDVREVEVLQAGRASGLKDVKVVGFSPTHTALKFVRPRKS